MVGSHEVRRTEKGVCRNQNTRRGNQGGTLGVKVARLLGDMRQHRIIKERRWS